MRHGSLFSGIGGFDLAAQWMGWENIFHCEIGEFGRKVLHHYWPKAIQYTDITKTDFSAHANTIDILTGGFPCQPYSTAGKRLGKEDDRHLWPEMLRAIREISPRWIVGENVRGLTNWNGGMVFDEVQADLEAEGYEVLPFLLPACAVNAPHRRDRIWFIAHSVSNGHRNDNGFAEDRCKAKENEAEAQREGWNELQRERLRGDVGRNVADGIITDTGLQRQEISQKQTTGIEQCDKGDATNAGNQGLQRSQINGGAPGSGTGQHEQPAGLFRSNWQEFPTVTPLCNGNDGISSRLDLTTLSFSKWRNESIKAGGNAIVPQVVFEIFKAIEQYESQSVQ